MDIKWNEGASGPACAVDSLLCLGSSVTSILNSFDICCEPPIYILVKRLVRFLESWRLRTRGRVGRYTTPEFYWMSGESTNYRLSSNPIQKRAIAQLSL